MPIYKICKTSYARILLILIIFWASQTHAVTFDDLHGKWISSDKETRDRLVATGNPQLEAFDSHTGSLGTSIVLDIDADTRIFTFTKGEYSSHSRLMQFKEIQANHVFVTLKADGFKEKPIDLKMTFLAPNKLEVDFDYRVPIVFIKNPETPSPSVKTALLPALKGTWLLNEVKDFKAKVVLKKTRNTDGYIELYIPPLDNETNSVTRQIPFSVKSVTPDGLVLHIHPAPAITIDNNKGATRTYLIEACDINVTFTQKNTIQVQTPWDQKPVTLIRK